MANENVNVTKGWLLDFYDSKIKPYLNGASGAIDDSSTASNKTWSASKINSSLDKHTYSTTEKAVSTWTDGKTVYEKTFSITVPSATTEGTYVHAYYSIGASVNQVIKMEGGFFMSGVFQSFPQFTNVASSSVFGTKLSILTNSASDTTNKNKLRVSNAHTAFNGYTGYAVVQYTKV